MHWCNQETEMLRSLYPLIVFPLAWAMYKGALFFSWLLEFLKRTKDV